MSVYIVINYKILDRNKINELTERVIPIDKKYGAEVIVGSPVKTVEGNALPNMVIYKFNTFEAAKDWYFWSSRTSSHLLQYVVFLNKMVMQCGTCVTDHCNYK